MTGNIWIWGGLALIGICGLSILFRQIYKLNKRLEKEDR